MKQRREARLLGDQPVIVTVLGECQVRLPAKVKNATGRGLGLEMTIPISIGAALKIETDDSILLGEAMYCRLDVDSYFIGVELEQALCGLAELGQALRGFAEDSADMRHAYAMNHGKN